MVNACDVMASKMTQIQKALGMSTNMAKMDRGHKIFGNTSSRAANK
jgi:hypothetical protein